MECNAPGRYAEAFYARKLTLGFEGPPAASPAALRPWVLEILVLAGFLAALPAAHVSLEAFQVMVDQALGTIVLYTDGVLDAVGFEGRFGERGLAAAVQSAREHSGESAAELIMAAIEGFLRLMDLWKVKDADARQLLGTSYPGSINIAEGARSESGPLPSTHCVGIEPGSAANRGQSTAGTAAPTHESDKAPPGSPVAAVASARRSGRNKMRNSPIPPRTTPIRVR